MGELRRQRRVCVGACEWWLVPEESLSDVTYSPGPEETWHGGAESVTFGVAWPGFQTFPLTCCVALDRSLGLSEPLIVEPI